MESVVYQNLGKKIRLFSPMSSEIFNTLMDCPGCGNPLSGSRCDTCAGAWENDICGGCGRTKKACQAANGSGCSRS